MTYISIDGDDIGLRITASHLANDARGLSAFVALVHTKVTQIERLLTGAGYTVIFCAADGVVAHKADTDVDANGVQKRVGLIVDFVSVLRDLKKALQFDSADVSGVIEDLDLLLDDLLKKIERARIDYLEVSGEGSADEKLEKIVYGRFLDPEPRKAFFDAYKEVEALWEILSPSPELRDHIATFKRLAQLYATVRNAYADRGGCASPTMASSSRRS